MRGALQKEDVAAGRGEDRVSLATKRTILRREGGGGEMRRGDGGASSGGEGDGGAEEGGIDGEVTAASVALGMGIGIGSGPSWGGRIAAATTD